MSLVKIQGNASGTGTLTIAAPNTNSDRTLTLPDATGTVALQGGTGVGKVLQVVQGSLQTLASSTSATYASTGLEATITPTSSSSKVLVLITAWCRKEGGSYMGLKLYKNGSSIAAFAAGLLYTANTNTNDGAGSFNYLDSPATTSSTTYTLYFANTPATGTVKINSDGSGNSYSTITLLEIAA